MGFNSINYQDYRGRVIAAAGRVMSGQSRNSHNVPGNLFELKRCLCLFVEDDDLDWKELAEQVIIDIFKATGVSASVDQFLKGDL
jgi:hypothetical protein